MEYHELEYTVTVRWSHVLAAASVTHSCHVSTTTSHMISTAESSMVSVVGSINNPWSGTSLDQTLAFSGVWPSTAENSPREGTACCSRSETQSHRACTFFFDGEGGGDHRSVVVVGDGDVTVPHGPRNHRCRRPRCRNKVRVGACLVRRPEVAGGI